MILLSCVKDFNVWFFVYIVSVFVGDKFLLFYFDLINVIFKVFLDGFCFRNVWFFFDVVNK